MSTFFVRPFLKDLTVGSRIAFSRRMRGMSRKELALKIGLGEKNGCRIMSRYERSTRIPSKEKLRAIADCLKINIRMISEYDLSNVDDVICILFWIDELCPNYVLSPPESSYMSEIQKYCSDIRSEWLKMKNKLQNEEISYVEYREWKMQ